jgi:predicted PhzF superfamily epimerase YddE/YHI9
MAALPRLTSSWWCPPRASTPGVDFVSRWCGPRADVPEDPVTGSAHCELVPYWAEELGKTRLTARQLLVRGGELECEL